MSGAVTSSQSEPAPAAALSPDTNRWPTYTRASPIRSHLPDTLQTGRQMEAAGMHQRASDRPFHCAVPAILPAFRRTRLPGRPLVANAEKSATCANGNVFLFFFKGVIENSIVWQIIAFLPLSPPQRNSWNRLEVSGTPCQENDL